MAGASLRPSFRARAVVAMLVLTAGCGSSSTTTVPPAECPTFGTTGAAAGEAAVTREPAVALLGNVQVQASACVDEVAFSFMGGLPGWRVHRADGPFTEDASGQRVAIAGDSALIVRFEPAAGVDLAPVQPIEIYDGPEVMTPPRPSDVVELRQLGDFESVISWAVAIDESRPFEVVARGEQLVLRIAVAAPRTTRCASSDADVTVGYPEDWYAELSDRWSCRYFDPEPFVVHPATNDRDWAVSVQAADVDAEAVLARLSPGEITTSVTEVAGIPATVLDVVEDGSGLLPAGFSYRMYVVDTDPRALIIMGASSPPGPRVETNRVAVDRIASMVDA